MRTGDEAPRRQDLRRDHVNEHVADAQWEQPELRSVKELPIGQRAHVARKVEPLERHVQPAGERANVFVLGNDAGRDQHAVGADAEGDGSLLGAGERARRQLGTQAIEFRTARAPAALRTKNDAAWFRHEWPRWRTRPPVFDPLEIDTTQAAAPSRHLVYKQAADGPSHATTKFEV